MVLLQKTPYLCQEDNNTTTHPSIYEDNKLVRRPSLSLSRWRVLRPVASVANLVNSTLLHLRDGLTEEERALVAKKEEGKQILSLRMKNAEVFANWSAAAQELDILEDNEAWKHDLSTSEIDVVLLETRLQQLDEARTNCDVKRMLHLVRTALSRDLGGMDNIRLYKHSHIGTKALIEKYIDSTIETIRALVRTSKHSMPEGLESKDMLEHVVYARQAFGRSALLLSGGATFGMNHVGVLKALFEAKLLPRIISGASAGSIVCSILCTRTDEEIPAVLEEFPYGDLAVFEDATKEDSVLQRMQRLLTEGAWIDIKHLTRVMRELLGDMTFQEAYNRTRRILNICVSSASVYELPRLLNYVTSPNVMIWSAVAASCSVPLLFSACQLLVKNPLTGENSPWNPTPQRWIDGSVDNDLPMTRLAEMFNVNHFIVSQVNPHVVPFLVKDDEQIGEDTRKEGESSPRLIHTLTQLAKDEALHRMHMLAELGIFPNLVTKARSVLSQKYSGDITILPAIEYKHFPRMLKNPTSDFMVQSCLAGERATWPKLSRIRNRCAVELELDAAVQALRARVVFSPSQVELRRMTTGSVRGSIGRGGLQRRDSGSYIESMTRNDEVDDENVHNSRTSVYRPPNRNSSGNFLRRPMPPLIRSQTSTHPFNFSMLDSSAGETTYSARSSDADVDSSSEPSSPESDDEDLEMPERRRKVDLFSSSQPVTPGTDHILATSPLPSKNVLIFKRAIPNTSEPLQKLDAVG
jgi:TAG lipase/steryl ester hydrolase/phospholipase A2/LPA acyltransferase